MAMNTIIGSHKPCGCKSCQDEITRQIKEALHEQHETHNHLAEISYALKLLIGVQQRMLMKFEEAFGTPRGKSYVFSQASPAQNTVYAGPPVAYDGVIRALTLSGPGNVTLSIQDKLSITGSTNIAIVGCNGGAVDVTMRHKIPVGGTLSVSTDSNAGTGLLALTAWIEPIKESNPEYFQLRR